mmetsp:Transcript_18951/g.53656  ORF Transcript_18951/g.53656 Transcript_18951/m.53656 type:complete len:182 (-) Transcript_18951:234-779(-)
MALCAEIPGSEAQDTPGAAVRVYSMVSGDLVTTFWVDAVMTTDALKRRLAAVCGTIACQLRLFFNGEEIEAYWQVPVAEGPVKLGMLKVLSCVEVVARPLLGPPIHLQFHVDLSAETVGDLKARIEDATLQDFRDSHAQDRYYPRPRQRLRVAGETLSDDSKMLFDCGGIHFQGVAVECDG